MSVIAHYKELADKGVFDDRMAEVVREDPEDLVESIRMALDSDPDRLEAWWEAAIEEVARQVAREQEEL